MKNFVMQYCNSIPNAVTEYDEKKHIGSIRFLNNNGNLTGTVIFYIIDSGLAFDRYSFSFDEDIIITKDDLQMVIEEYLSGKIENKLPRSRDKQFILFRKAMDNYALPQGDIALFMNEYAECRSNTRGIIGYEDQDLIDQLVDKHENRVKKTRERYKAIHETIVTKEGEAAYAKIKTALDAYLAKEAEIIKIGATTDQAQCRIAQDMAINELAPLYETLDAATLELMNINIEKEHQMETITAILEWGSVAFIVILICSIPCRMPKISNSKAYAVTNIVINFQKKSYSDKK